MMNILERIVAYKGEEVEAAKHLRPRNMLEDLPQFGVPCYSMKRFLLDRSRTGIIAEYKRRSPSRGIINDNAGVLPVTEAYASNGASGVSVLTDTPSFGGSIDDLISARAVSLPILRKEFIVDPYQVVEARAYGADAILLIAAILSKSQVEEFALQAMELGLEVILEIHDESELEHICHGVDIVGVNNRNLKTFEVSLAQSAALAGSIPKDKIKISESGIHTIHDIRYLQSLGFDGFLIGESFMKEADPGLAFMKFANELMLATDES
ncbi:MAG TPA: indole-3-glycerol phosphate synthase TrpC [Flavisolibacter sp.]|nr:indole-3-glycerol phosphate synthase TrpC [Flavisolibacter sp.]